MWYRTTRPITAIASIVLVVFAYFIAYPEDASTVTAPVAIVLRLSEAVSRWLYLVIAVSVIAWAVVRTWGPKGTLR
jgi:hypothetical protein